MSHENNKRAADALLALHRLGAIQSPWLPGMRDEDGRRVERVETLDTDFGREVYVHWYDEEEAEFVGDCLTRPDTDEPLTVAALGLLAREAWHAFVWVSRVLVVGRTSFRFMVCGLHRSDLDSLNAVFGYDAEADAWIAVLEAMALGGDT